MTEYIRQSFTEEHILGLVSVVQDLDQVAVSRMSSDVDLAKLCIAVDQAVHLLLVSHLLSSDQQVNRLKYIFFFHSYQ